MKRKSLFKYVLLFSTLFSSIISTTANAASHDAKSTVSTASSEALVLKAFNTILTTPEKLNVDTINKYLELKSRGVI